MEISNKALATFVVVAFGALAATAAHADSLVTVTPSGVPPVGSISLATSWYSTATGQTPTTITGTGVNGDGNNNVLVNDLTGNAAATYTFGNTFTNPNGSFPAAQLISITTTAGTTSQSYGFIDTYVIDLPAAQSNAYVFSLNLSSQLGLTNLTARLYDYSANGVNNLTIGGAGALSSGTGIIDLWSPSTNGTVSSTLLPTTNLAAGEYVLQIAGIETGTSAGTYSGQLNITPVPVPGTWLLLLSGIGLCVWGVRRQGGKMQPTFGSMA